MKVIVNGKDFTLPVSDRWFYSDAVGAALFVSGKSHEEKTKIIKDKVLFTATYCDADEIPSEGTLIPYPSTKQIKVKDGTIFNVIDTSNA
jgi:hypothetical protein